MSRYRILSPTDPDPAFVGRCALAVMAKAPVPGKVKTRLSPPLTPLEAADLNACFLRDTVANLAAATQQCSADWIISYTPTGAESAFDGILPAGALLLPQRGDGFGERLLATAQDLFACGFSAVCLIDSDSPTVPTREFSRSADELLRPGRRAVLGASADGGYYLIGLQTPEPILFDRITWSTEKVAAETLARAAEIDLPVTLLEEWYDVDDAASLDRLERELDRELERELDGELDAELARELDTDSQVKGYPAPYTRAYLAQRAAREASIV
jgi:rSAM/selenodomain-associated transferase 1